MQYSGYYQNCRGICEHLWWVKEEIGVQDVVSHLVVSRSTASRLLKKLTQDGFLRKMGKGPVTRYRKH